MKSDILLFPSSEKSMLISLFSKFFQENLLSEKEHNRDKKSYDKNYEIWQKFIEAFQKDDPSNTQYKEVIKDMTVQIQENSAVIPYLAEFNSLILKTNEINSNFNTNNGMNTQPHTDYQKNINLIRQHSNPPKPSQIGGDIIVDEEKDMSQKISKGIRTHKKTFSSIINNGQQKYIFEGRDYQHHRKPHSIIDISGINTSIDIQQNQSSCKSSKYQPEINSSLFYGQSRSNKQIYNSIDMVNSSQNINRQSEITQLIDFLVINNTNNYIENYQTLLQDNNFIENKTAYIFKLFNGIQEKMMSMIDKLLFAVNISHYQDMFQNNSPEKWQNLFQNLTLQKYSSIGQKQQNFNNMDSQQLDFMKQSFIEFYDCLQQKKDNPIRIFGEFLQRAQTSDQFSECLQKSLKDQIISISHLNDKNDLHQDVFNNWFVKNEQNNMIEIDSQKLKQLSYSLKKKIIIFKVSSTMNSTNTQYSTSSIQILQPFEHNAADRSTINILWHNTSFADNFYLILNEQQKLYYQNIIQQRQEIKSQYSSIQIKEISLQGVSESFSTKANSSVNSPFSVSSSKHKSSYDIQHDQTNQLSQFSTSLSSYNIQQNHQQQRNVNSPLFKKDSPFLQKYQSNPNSPQTRTTLQITGFQSDSLGKLKENVSKLKLMMIEDAFNINSLVMQIENNWIPRQNTQFVRNHIRSPTQIITQHPLNVVRNDFEKIQNRNYQQIHSSNSLNNEPIHQQYIPSQFNNNNIQIYGNQNKIDELSQNRGREYVQPQMKIIMNQNTRSSSQNQISAPQEEQIKNISSNQYYLNYNPSSFQNNQRIPQIKKQDARIRIQSGHVPSVNAFFEEAESNKYPSTNLFANVQIEAHKNVQSNLNNLVLNKISSAHHLSKNEEQRVEEQIDNRSGYGQQMIQLLNNPSNLSSKYGIKSQNMISIQKQDDDKNFLKLIGTTHANSTTNQQQTSYNQNLQSNPSQFFSRNNLNESPIRNQNVMQVQKLMKSASCHQSANNLSPRKEISINPGIQNHQDYHIMSKLITPKGVPMQQNVIIR